MELREAAGLEPAGYRADRRLMEIDMGDDTWKLPRDVTHFGADHWDYVRPNAGMGHLRPHCCVPSPSPAMRFL
jgi:hypothetical protein